MQCTAKEISKKIIKLRSKSRYRLIKMNAKTKLLERDNNKCQICGSKNDLQIDHIKSLYFFIYNNLDTSMLDNFDNLRILCKRCNAKRNPEDIT